MVQVEELYRIRGFDAKTVAKLKPFVTALPARTPVNVNTAPAEVLAAIVPELSRSRASAPSSARAPRSPSRPRPRSPSAGRRRRPRSTTSTCAAPYFSARIAVAQDDVQLASEALIDARRILRDDRYNLASPAVLEAALPPPRP